MVDMKVTVPQIGSIARENIKKNKNVVEKNKKIKHVNSDFLAIIYLFIFAREFIDSILLNKVNGFSKVGQRKHHRISSVAPINMICFCWDNLISFAMPLISPHTKGKGKI